MPYFVLSYYLNVRLSRLMTSVREERAVFSAIVYNRLLLLFEGVSSYSGCLGKVECFIMALPVPFIYEGVNGVY